MISANADEACKLRCGSVCQNGFLEAPMSNDELAQ